MSLALDPARSEAPPRRRFILEATLRVIARGGADAVTHREVAAEAGVPLGSTTYYFASRDDLLREAFRHHVAGVFAFLTSVGDEYPTVSVDGLVEFLVEVARREFTDSAKLLVEYELILRAARDPALAREFAAYERALESALAARLERLGAPQPFDAARTIVALVRGSEVQGLVRPADVGELRRRLRPVVAALAHGPSKSAAAPRSARRAIVIPRPSVPRRRQRKETP